MAVPAKRKLKHYRGDDFRYAARIETADDPADPDSPSSIQDLTGWTAEVESDPDVTASVKPDPLDATGTITVEIPKEDLGDDQVEVVVFDVSLMDPTGFRRTYLHITLRLQAQVK